MSEPLGCYWCHTSSRVGRAKPCPTGGRTQLMGCGWSDGSPAMLLPGRSSVDLRAALGRHAGMVPGHPSSSVMTRHPHSARQPLSRACPQDWTLGCSDQPPVGPPSWEAGMAVGTAGAGGALHASAGHFPGTHPADLAARDPPLPALLLLGHTFRAGPRSLLWASGAHGPAWSHLAGGLLPSSQPFLLLCPASSVPAAPQGGAGSSHSAHLQLQALGPLPSPHHPLTPLAPWQAMSPAKWPLLWPAQLSKLRNKPDPPLPPACYLPGDLWCFAQGGS